MRYIRDQLEARSVLNTGFYKLFKNITKYNQELSFKPWFKTIIVNTALDYLRSNKRLLTQASLDQEANLSISSEAISNLSFEDMMKVVDQLPTAYRTVFNMYVIDGFKHEEIAQKLGIGIGTSKSNLSRAKEKLRKMIDLNILV